MITFDNWRLASDGAVLAMQYDNMSRLLEVLGDIPEGWTWTMLVSVGDALDVISMSEVPGGLEAVLTAETLALSGNWTVSLGGTLPLSYDAVVSAFSQPVDEQVVSILFVLEWA